MKLGICIYHSLGGGSDREKTLASLKDIYCENTIYLFQSFEEVRDFLRTANEDWFLILSDQEIFDAKLVEVMEVLLLQQNVDAYSFYCVKNINGDPLITKSMRLIRQTTELQPILLLPRDENKEVVNILDGWIFEHGMDANKICRFSQNI